MLDTRRGARRPLYSESVSQCNCRLYGGSVVPVARLTAAADVRLRLQRRQTEEKTQRRRRGDDCRSCRVQPLDSAEAAVVVYVFRTFSLYNGFEYSRRRSRAKAKRNSMDAWSLYTLFSSYASTMSMDNPCLLPALAARPQCSFFFFYK